LRVQVHDGVLQVVVPPERPTTSGADIFILWMVGSAFGPSRAVLGYGTGWESGPSPSRPNFGKGRSV
jgi:hypothetical protein